MLREMVARRIFKTTAHLPLKTPILDQVARPAEVLSVSVFSGLGLEDWIDRIRDRIQDIIRPNGGEPIPPAPKLPTIIKGLLHGSEAGRWYRYDFPRPLKNAVVTATSNARATDFLNRLIERLELPDPKEAVGNGCRDAMSAAIPDLFGPIKDALCNSAYTIGYLTGGWFEWLWNILIQPQLDKVQDSMNLRLQDLYQMWGLPLGTALSSVMTRNSDDSGFEWLSLGEMTIQFQAIGDPE